MQLPTGNVNDERSILMNWRDAVILVSDIEKTGGRRRVLFLREFSYYLKKLSNLNKSSYNTYFGRYYKEKNDIINGDGSQNLRY